MSDIYIDGEMLERVQQDFRTIEDLLDRPARMMKDVSGADLGPDVLVSRVQDFGHAWGYGIDQLGKFSSSVVEALRSIDAAFAEADANLARALTEAAND